MKERILFDNYDLTEYREGAKEALTYDWLPEPDDDEIEQVVQDYLEEDWRDLSTFLDNSFDGHILIIRGAIGRWNGTAYGLARYKTWGDLISDFGKDCDYFKVWIENKHLMLRCSHHDGNNTCEIKVMTDKGEQYYENWANYSTQLDKYSEVEILNRIFDNSRYAKLPVIE